MKNNAVFAVTSYRSYENDEVYFGLDGLFLTEDDAEKYIREDMEETLQDFDPTDMEIDKDDFKIEGAGHCFRWELKECSLPVEKEKNNEDTSIGSGNTGGWNVGNGNAGSWNVGNLNIGSRNVGKQNIGDCNVGNLNSGCGNAGYWNIGYYNIGNRNTGHLNTGNRNTGDCNSTNNSSGCFNTVELTISFFNQPSNWTLSDWRKSKACDILSVLLAPPVQWIEQRDMTNTEKQEHPEYATTKGYLKTLSEEEQMNLNVQRWNALSEDEKRIVLSIPNFDGEIFKEITGIDVGDIAEAESKNKSKEKGKEKGKEKEDQAFIVTEWCRCCESKIEMRWDTDVRGFQAFCPICGAKLMLCDECLHAPDGGKCDYSDELGVCWRSKKQNASASKSRTVPYSLESSLL